MEQKNQFNNLTSSQILVVAITLILAVTILAGIWIIRRNGFTPTPTPQEVTKSKDWPSIGPTFTPTSTSTPPLPTDTPTSTPTSTLTPTPSPTPSPTPRVVNIRELGYLTSVEFTTVTIVELEETKAISNPTGIGPTAIPVGKDRILMEAVGKIKFGIDLTQIKDTDIQVSGNDVRIILPRAEVIGVELLPSQTKIYDTETSWLLSEYEGLESRASDKAKWQLENWAKGEGNLIGIAERLASLQLEKFLHSLNFEKIEITIEGQGI